MLVEILDTGGFTWKVFSKKQKEGLPESFRSVPDSFMQTQNCGPSSATYVKMACIVRTSGCCLLPRAARITVSVDVCHQRKYHVILSRLVKSDSQKAVSQCIWKL